MIQTDFLHKLDKFSIILNKRVTSNYVGEKKSESVGRGLIFKDHTLYVPGEDFRSIDWRVFGRTDKLFVKRYEEERNLTVHVIVDMSGSMNFGTKVTKAEYASMIGLGFGYLALKNNERFVLCTFSDKLDVFRPQRGKRQITSALDYLNKKKAAGESKLDDSIGSYKPLIKSRSMVVIISDFLYPIEEIKKTLQHLKKQEVILIQVLDVKEKNLDLEGDYKLHDAESKETLQTFINPYTKKQYSSMLEEHNSKIHNEAERYGAKFFSTDTGKPVFDTFFEVLNYRGRRRGG
ncbi:DUF58 domain-containing protein [Candidatus Woesearchaeota archaeon]|nr:DUF58 domain-containing protein [Candidatus Woesearchaeota archaeon]